MLRQAHEEADPRTYKKAHGAADRYEAPDAGTDKAADAAADARDAAALEAADTRADAGADSTADRQTYGETGAPAHLETRLALPQRAQGRRRD